MILVVSLLLVASASGSQQQISNGWVTLDTVQLNAEPQVELLGPWRYSPDDRPEWASRELDDHDWQSFDPAMPNGAPDDWAGIGWFRLRISVPEKLVNVPMMLWFARFGAMHIYLDGEQVGAFGDPGRYGEDFDPLVGFRSSPVPVTFRRRDAVLAVRFATSDDVIRFIAPQGGACAVAVGLASQRPQIDAQFVRVLRFYRFFIGVSFALGLLHFLLFVFLPERKENLQYALATWSVCGLTIFVDTRSLPVSSTYFVFAFIGFKVCVLGVAVFGVKFYHAILGDPPRLLFKLYVVLGVALALTASWVPLYIIYIYAVIGILEQVRLTMVANIRGLRDAWILAVGVAVSSVGALLQMMPFVLGAPMPISDAYLYGFLVMLTTMSAYQARGFARTYRDLQFRLDDVRRLSEERVEQARRVKSEEMARVRLEEENKRQAVELEEASKRQAMLAQLEAAHKELKETQAQLVQSEKMASLGQLVAGIAHEINTPVGAISSVHDSLSKATIRLKEALRQDHPELLEENRRIKASLKVIEDANGVIESGSGRVAKIVRRLKSFARLDEAELLRADPHEGLDDTLVLLQHELKRDIKVHRNYGNVPPFPCFPSQLNQVFLNLLVNARQAIEGPGEIFIETKVVDGDAHISIRDTGRGIPKENLSRIFDPGFTTKGVKIGTGLGLSICYRIIKEHRGEIRVGSVEGEGSTFTVVLPLDLDQRLGTGT